MWCNTRQRASSVQKRPWIPSGAAPSTSASTSTSTSSTASSANHGPAAAGPTHRRAARQIGVRAAAYTLYVLLCSVLLAASGLPVANATRKATRIISPTPVVATTPSVSTIPWFYGKHLHSINHTIVAELISVSPGVVCSSKIKDLNVTGRIVYTRRGTCNPADVARAVAKHGGIASIVDLGFVVPGFDQYWFHEPSADDVNVYCFSVDNGQGDDIAAAIRRYSKLPQGGGAQVEISLDPQGKVGGMLIYPNPLTNASLAMAVRPASNPWSEVVESPGWIFFQVFFTLLSVMNIGIAGQRFKSIGDVRGYKLSIPLFCLGMETLSNVLRGFVIAVDPVGSRLILPRMLNFVLFTITIPLNMITTIVLVFFFHELTAASKLSGGGAFLKSTKTKVAAGSIAILLLFADVFTSITRSINNYSASGLFLAFNVVVTLLTIVIASFFIYTCWQVRKFLTAKSGPNKSDSKTQDSVNRLTINVFVSAILMVAEVFWRLIAVWVRTPWAWYWFIFLGSACSIAKSFFQILAFAVHSKRKEIKTEITVMEGSSANKRASTTASSRTAGRRFRPKGAHSRATTQTSTVSVSQVNGDVSEAPLRDLERVDEGSEDADLESQGTASTKSVTSAKPTPKFKWKSSRPPKMTKAYESTTAASSGPLLQVDTSSAAGTGHNTASSSSANNTPLAPSTPLSSVVVTTPSPRSPASPAPSTEIPGMASLIHDAHSASAVPPDHLISMAPLGAGSGSGSGSGSPDSAVE